MFDSHSDGLDISINKLSWLECSCRIQKVAFKSWKLQQQQQITLNGGCNVGFKALATVGGHRRAKIARNDWTFLEKESFVYDCFSHTSAHRHQYKTE